MDPIRFFDHEDATQPGATRIGQGGFELVRAAASGLQVVPTFIVGSGVFRSYQAADQLDNAVISEIISFASEAEAAELIIRPTTAQALIGLPGPEQAGVERGHIRYLIERIYRSWNSSRAKVYRESQRIAQDQVYPSVIVQVPRGSRSLSLSSRNPRTGEPTGTDDYRYNVNNHIEEFRSEYINLIGKVEDVRRRPTQIDFQEYNDSIYIVWLDSQVMSTDAMVSFICSQYEAGRIADIQVLSMLEPRMLGGVTRRSYEVISEDSWTVRGIAASPGIASGHLIWRGSSEWDARRSACIFVCREVSPEDSPILRHCVGAFSTRGSITSHLAVIARSLQIPAVVGVDLEVDTQLQIILLHGERVPGNSATVYGHMGIVALGDRPRLRAVNNFGSLSSTSFVDWVDGLAQSVVDRGEFAGLPLSLQTHIAGLRQMARKIQVGHD